MQFAKCEGHITLLGDFFRVIARLRNRSEDLTHFILGFEIELIVGKSHAILFIHRRSHLDAHQDILCHRIFLAHIMRVVGRNKWNPGFCMKPLHIRQNACFFLQPLILQFKVKITLAEDIQHFQCFFLSTFVIAV